MNTNIKPKSSAPPPPAATSLHDIYYVLFRHKWLIILLATLGAVSSYAVFSLWHFPYTSEAKIFIRYIQDVPGPSEIDDMAHVQHVDGQGANILNTEIEFLKSADLALQVATNLTPRRILGPSADSNGLNAANAAAAFIRGNLNAEVPMKSDVIVLTFTANDPDIVQPVLSSLIEAYRNRYKEIYLTPGFTDASLSEQADIAKGHLQDTMKTLDELKKQLGITSLDDAEKNEANRLAMIQNSIFEAQEELAEAESTINDLHVRVPGATANASQTNHPGNSASTAQPLPPSREIIAKYQNLMDALNARRAYEQDMRNQFTPSSERVQKATQRREAAEADLNALEAQNPGLVSIKQNESGAVVAAGPDFPAMLRDAQTKQHAQIANYQVLTNQLFQVKADIARLDDAEEAIMQAQSERDLAEKKYERFRNATEQFRINDAMGNKVSNISTVEQPTPPARDSKKILKMAGGVMGFFLALALGLPFLIERVLDQSFKHPLDVQARIAAPFFITIPRTNGHGKLVLKRAKQVPLLAADGHAASAPDAVDQNVSLPADGQMVPWDQRHELRPFFETLRDRLMIYFEMINLTHKPKLVAVTSCGPGAGVTTTAAGLASSLSEIGEGNVLLVNMNVGDGEAHHFYKGRLACGIEDVLGKEKRTKAQVQENLYVAKETEANDNLPRVLPKRFSHLLPMMKASDFDYIIFDMPPVSEISITPRLARFMDMVLLVVESEKTSRDAATRVTALLQETKTNVGLVLNKNRSYLPKRLNHTL